MATTPRAANQNGSDLGDNPMLLVAGGVAIGVLIGMLLPRIAKERELLDPIGEQLAERASAAVAAAKETGKAEIESLLPDRDATKDRVTTLFSNMIDAATGAAQQRG